MKQGLSSKEAELLKDGSNGDKSCSYSKRSSIATELARNMDPSTSEADMPSPSIRTTSCGLDSQLKTEADATPSTSGASKNCLFKIGMCSIIQQT